MNPPSIDICTILQAESALDLEYLTNLFVGKEEATPDNCVTVFDTYGAPPMLTMDVASYNYPSVQIRVRNRSYTDGWDLI